MKQIVGESIHNITFISILMYHMLLHKAQTQHKVIFITGSQVRRQGDQ